MRRFRLAVCHDAPTEQLIDECVEQLGDVPGDGTIGFIYATDTLAGDLEGIVQRLRLRTGVAHWVGTVGQGISATGREIYEDSALVVMMARFADDDFRVIPGQSRRVHAWASRMAGWTGRHGLNFGIVHGDPTNAATPGLIGQLAEQVPGAFLVGGLTSSGAGNPQVADGITEGGISGVLFSDRVPVTVGHTQGCTPIAGMHRITRAQRNVLVELDGRPALEVFREDIGEVLAKDLRRAAGYIFAALPVPGSDTGDYTVRNLLGIDTEQGLIAVGEMLEEGGEVMFCRRDGNSAREDLLRMLGDIARRLPGEPRGGLYFSCLGRGRYQFGENSEELRIIRDRLGDFPLAGFFANGEIFNNRLYGYTGVLTVFS